MATKKIKTAAELAEACKRAADDYKSLYVMGCFGAPMTAANKARYTTNHKYNKQADRKALIMAASADTFGFDCVGLIKAMLWGWCGDVNAVYGGATYCSNGVPDLGANGMIDVCSGVSDDFTAIEIGEVVWTTDHIGVYIGGGLAVECSPRWKDKVQITACNCTKSGYNTRTWKKHGCLPYVTYTGNKESVKGKTTNVSVSLPVLKLGARSGYVKSMQILINAYDGAKLVTDGYFGNSTQAALIAYQTKRGLAADGVCGKATWTQLLK